VDKHPHGQYEIFTPDKFCSVLLLFGYFFFFFLLSTFWGVICNFSICTVNDVEKYCRGVLLRSILNLAVRARKSQKYIIILFSSEDSNVWWCKCRRRISNALFWDKERNLDKLTSKFIFVLWVCLRLNSHYCATMRRRRWCRKRRHLP